MITMVPVCHRSSSHRYIDCMSGVSRLLWQRWVLVTADHHVLQQKWFTARTSPHKTYFGRSFLFWRNCLLFCGGGILHQSGDMMVQISELWLEIFFRQVSNSESNRSQFFWEACSACDSGYQCITDAECRLCLCCSLIPSLYISLKSEGHSFVDDDAVSTWTLCYITLQIFSSWCTTNHNCRTVWSRLCAV